MLPAASVALAVLTLLPGAGAAAAEPGPTFCVCPAVCGPPSGCISLLLGVAQSAIEAATCVAMNPSGDPLACDPTVRYLVGYALWTAAFEARQATAAVACLVEGAVTHDLHPERCIPTT